MKKNFMKHFATLLGTLLLTASLFGCGNETPVEAIASSAGIVKETSVTQTPVKLLTSAPEMDSTTPASEADDSAASTVTVEAPETPVSSYAPTQETHVAVQETQAPVQKDEPPQENATSTPATDVNDSNTSTSNADTYFCSRCGSTEHTAVGCSYKEASKGVYVGRWRIPDVGVSVACYKGGSQSICDDWDSAAFFGYGYQYVIGDHNYQGFEAIKSCTVGMLAYFDTPTGTEEYICTGLIQGHNVGDLTDANYNDIRYMNDGITCYTCNSTPGSITIVFFQPTIKIETTPEVIAPPTPDPVGNEVVVAPTPDPVPEEVIGTPRPDPAPKEVVSAPTPDPEPQEEVVSTPTPDPIPER